MQIITETELLDRISAFRAQHGDMAPTTFGRNATGNANLIKELEEGKSPSLRTAKRIADYMATKDAEAATRAKLDAPLELLDPVVEAEQELPFSQAPGAAGASSAISSSTSALPRSAGASRSCRSTAAAAGIAPNRSCSAEAK